MKKLLLIIISFFYIFAIYAENETTIKTHTSLSSQDLKKTENIKRAYNYIGTGSTGYLKDSTLHLFSNQKIYIFLGRRMQYNHHGRDCHLSILSSSYETQIKFSGQYQYFFNPFANIQYYSGLGASFTIQPYSYYNGYHANINLSPEVVLGVQYQNQSKQIKFLKTQFLEAQLSFPIFWPYHSYTYVDLIPEIELKYGWGF